MDKETLIKIWNKISKVLFATLAVYVVTLSGGGFKLPEGAYIHIGDAAVYLLALLFPAKIAIPAAALGCAFADKTLGSENYILATLIIKVLTVLAAKGAIKLSKDPLTQDLLVCLAGLVTIGGYYIADVALALIAGNGFIDAMKLSFEPIMYNALQALICALIYLVLATFARKLKNRKKEKTENDNTQGICENQPDA